MPRPAELRPADREMLAELEHGFTTVGQAIAGCHFKDGINAAMAVARAANRYLDEQAPWKQIKVDREAAGTTIYTMLQVISGLRVLFCPYLPFSSQHLHEYLGFTGEVSKARWENTTVEAGKTLPRPAPLFAKLETAATV
ncbi:MAG TPA: class I tRNA ligase family protein [Ktedonobacteraceae bacterium]|nr:class I tRNA ligase family protein [Ktedonobacteraceae bacterium]